MRSPRNHLQHTYRLVLAEDGRGVARAIEFEASGAESALHHAQQQCRGREAELFEGDRSLGRLRCVPHGGFWVLSPPGEPSHLRGF
ncbi:MAG TPA: hypothetical protein VKY80_05315 [Croceibacterium sp.]|nr:hypothetical protein [Croceibacterium sp.]